MVMWGVIDGSVNEAQYNNLVVNSPRTRGSYDAMRNAPPLPINRHFVLIAEFEFDLYARWLIQTFPVEEHIKENGFDFGVVVLEVLWNWGGPETCLH